MCLAYVMYAHLSLYLVILDGLFSCCIRRQDFDNRGCPVNRHAFTKILVLDLFHQQCLLLTVGKLPKNAAFYSVEKKQNCKTPSCETVE